MQEVFKLPQADSNRYDLFQRQICSPLHHKAICLRKNLDFIGNNSNPLHCLTYALHLHRQVQTALVRGVSRPAFLPYFYFS